MSSPDPLTRRAVLLGLAAVAALPLAGCFTPLYGPAAQGGGDVGAMLAQIRVEPVAAPVDFEPLAHRLRQELVFALDGSGTATSAGDKTMRLVVSASVAVTTPIVSATTVRASVATLLGTAAWRLETLDGTRVLASGTVDASATYERLTQRFAAQRAERDAQIRLADQIADQLRTRLAIRLRTGFV